MISPAREAGLLGSKGSALALQRPCATPPISALPDGRLPPNSLFNTGPSPFPSGLGSGSPSTNLTSAASRLHPSPVTNQEQPIWGSGGGGVAGQSLGDYWGCLQDSPLTSHCRPHQCGHLSLLGLCPALPRGRTQCPVCRAPAPGCALVQVPRFAGRPGPSAQHSTPLPRHAPLWYK